MAIKPRLEKDHLISGALLADVGKLIEYQENKKGEITKSRTGRFFATIRSSVWRWLINGEFLAEVQHVIATHSKEGEMMQRSNESVIFHHADFIDFDLVSKKKTILGSSRWSVARCQKKLATYHRPLTTDH